jgi:hypothetical protein
LRGPSLLMYTAARHLNARARRSHCDSTAPRNGCANYASWQVGSRQLLGESTALAAGTVLNQTH